MTDQNLDLRQELVSEIGRVRTLQLTYELIEDHEGVNVHDRLSMIDVSLEQADAALRSEDTVQMEAALRDLRGFED